ncbi:hypothetical protein IFM12276_07280 [Nocardia sputorum]|uniref:Uncharacterized protein n=1 Tax=Nocardia sputorum TaxID=2984338 RepID=A0ABN6TXR7_9NOCA|nr:hypothetical protein IFM12276_07280 [Nocardia sputorum]
MPTGYVRTAITPRPGVARHIAARAAAYGRELRWKARPGRVADRPRRMSRTLPPGPGFILRIMSTPAAQFPPIGRAPEPANIRTARTPPLHNTPFRAG